MSILITSLAVISNLNAQISNGGTPYSIVFQVNNNCQELSFPAPDLQSIALEDQINEAKNPNAPHRMGISVPINSSISTSGTWTDIEDVGRIWRLKLIVPNALAIGVYYDDFYIPEGGQLFLYNSDRSQIIGSYNNTNNPENNLFATEFIEGDVVTLEYFQPIDAIENARINISEVAYAYREIEFMYNRERSSWYCMINVVCEEGDGWENQIKGVARMSIKIGGSYYWCSGSLINNTDNDRTPYFLSAAHCGEGSNSSDRNQWIFYFNFQASTCNGNNSSSNSITGCQLRARDVSYADAGSDFDLVEFNSSIPNSYDVYYNGWNRTNSNDDAGNGVGIHHPAGDIKKISTYDTPLQLSTFWNGLPTHWKLIWAETANGKSIMQGGSSGSPIFDSNGLIMGDLTGGYTSNSCTTPSPAYYGKIYYSWDQNGTTASTRLKDWLDPGDTGIEKLQGVSWEIIPPVADYEVASTVVTQGDTVFFTDLSGPGIMEWDWVFEDGNPSSSMEKNPFVVYADTGYMDVSLTVVNADGTDTEIKVDYIYVQQMDLPVADFESNTTAVSPGGTVSFTDLSTGDPNEWEWTFEGGSPGSSASQNPIVRYNTPGVYDVTLKAINLGGFNTIVKEDYIYVETVGIEDNTDNDNITIYPNPGKGIFHIVHSENPLGDFNIQVTDIAGNIIKTKNTKIDDNEFTINLSNESPGIYFVRIIDGNRTISKKISLLK